MIINQILFVWLNLTFTKVMFQHEVLTFTSLPHDPYLGPELPPQTTFWLKNTN